MDHIDIEDPLAVATVAAIRSGDVAALRRLLGEHPGLALASIRDRCGTSRTLLHVATDWPGHFPNGAATVAALVEAGADVDAVIEGTHRETPLHWAASSNDVAVLDALLDAGANIEAPSAVVAGGSPLADARGFGQWQAAHRLVERGARTTLKDAATLGLIDRVVRRFESAPPTRQEVTEAFWGACHGGQREAAEYLLVRGADINWVGHGGMTALEIARASAAEGLASAGHLEPWLLAHGAEPATSLRSVRRAVQDDAWAIASVLRRAFAEYEPSYTPSAFAATVPDTREILARWADGPVWVALRGNDIVGTVSAVEKDRGVYVRSMAIAPDARGLGLAERLLAAVEQFARDRHAARLFLSTTPFLADAIRFYVRLGFRRTNEGPPTLFGTPLFTMERPLSEDGATGLT